MSGKPRIVIVNYNGAAFVGAAVESALHQTTSCEIVVVDNASTDNSHDVLQRYDVRLVENERNTGFAMAANTGAFLQTENVPPYIAFLNPDAIAETTWIERIVAWMESRSIAFASSVVAGGERPFFSGGRWLPWLGAAVTCYSYTGERTAWVSGCALVARRESFEAVGGFDGRYFLYFEDVDLSLRARRQGFTLGVNPESLVSHPAHGRSTNQLGQMRKYAIGYYSKGAMLRRFLGPLQWLTAAPFQLILSPLMEGASPKLLPTTARAFLRGVFAR